jgi:hypothetical protein
MDVFIYKTDAMRKILNLVSLGYVRYTYGEIQPKKLQGFIAKSEDRYDINRTTQQRYRAKAKGEANSQLVLWLSGENIVSWFLLVTPGEGVVEDVEDLRDTRQKHQRLEVTGYKVSQMSRKDRAPSWTWRMTVDNRKAWQERLRTAVIAKNSELVRQAMFSLRRTPAFAESRREAFKLFNDAKKHWKKIHGQEWPFEDIFIGWFGKFEKGKVIDSAKITSKASAVKAAKAASRPS